MTRDDTDDADGPDGREAETPYQRLTRNWAELLQEIRVAQTGVQILFGFLLTLPFSARFGVVEPYQRAIFIGVLLLTALASALLIGPVAFHRIVFRHHARAELVRTANALALGGLAVLGLAIIGVVLLVVSVLTGVLTTVLIASGTAATFVVVWGVLPGLALRRSGPREGGHPADRDSTAGR
ncbi:conserved membrane hypothetical protein [Frankia canadensis]|uniref:Sodium:proton antiporter n=1 Tax=Frankia canadensis TaxID=1836972 RepID=A0A2I2KK42_9ACTN|nr:DUF6328 family protein [Frankia canadensis]SNQ46014.1 conserved membrane hypothetical protein [Frankia canadensis]SOU53304.1 conserved membrane hypothetical protein [Frankia canadensis]